MKRIRSWWRPEGISENRTHKTRNKLHVESLESRELPAINIVFDYRYDTSNFFNTVAKRADLQAAADAIGSKLGDQLSAISPSGTNTWSASFFNPATGDSTQLANLSVPANTLVIFVGARNLNSSELGLGGSGGYSASGTQSWFDTIAARGQANATGPNATDYGPWGGSISFESNPGGGGWYFNNSGAPIQSNQYDFFSVASHELGHILGLGLSQSWSNKVSGGDFVGTAASAVYGGHVPLNSDLAHWAPGVTSGGVQALMDPVISAGVQTHFTLLDQAALEDIGWQITPSSGSGGGTSSNPPTKKMFAVSGGPGSDARVSVYNTDGSLRFVLTVFQNYQGGVRIATGDVNGDGYDDLIVAAGPGAGPHVEVFDGQTGALIRSFYAYAPSFVGGISIAAGDINGDGKADIITGTLGGSDPHVEVFDGATNALIRSFDAFLPTFTGGINVAAADVNGDGRADVIASVYSNGPPHVVVFDGVTNNLLQSFYAYDQGFLGGVYVAAADVNGDGRADIITGAGSGPAQHVKVFSGSDGSTVASFLAGGLNTSSGVRVAAEDLDGDGKAEVITATGPSGNPIVRVFKGSTITSGNPQLLYSFSSFDNNYTNGIFVS